jgi:hypothetical protein
MLQLTHIELVLGGRKILHLETGRQVARNSPPTPRECLKKLGYSP